MVVLHDGVEHLVRHLRGGPVVQVHQGLSRYLLIENGKVPGGSARCRRCREPCSLLAFRAFFQHIILGNDRIREPALISAKTLGELHRDRARTARQDAPLRAGQGFRRATRAAEARSLFRAALQLPPCLLASSPMVVSSGGGFGEMSICRTC